MRHLLITLAVLALGGAASAAETSDIISYPPDRTWAFQPAEDTFSPDALLDLRYLNEKTAGEHGFIKRSPDGNDFVRGDGTPIRFWGGTTYVQRDAFRNGRDGWADLRHHARFLAKRGVNIVRLHGSVVPKSEGSTITDVDRGAVDEVWRLVAAMKQEGIYCTISPYWGSSTNLLKSWGVPDPTTGNCAGLVFFDRTMQEGYKAWLKAIYDPVNPYTSVRLADDPAVAIIQLQNEDSMLFFTMQRVKGAARRELELQYGEWLKQKYGSLEKARAAWLGNESPDDDFANGVVGMNIVWFFTQAAAAQVAGNPGLNKRLSDQLEFMARTMHNFNKMVEDYLRNELGCKQLINAGNWRTVDTVTCDPAERWSYTANEVIGKNSYYSPAHVGTNVGWQIRAGQHFDNASALLNPRALPFNVKQAVGHPFILPESLWVPPLGYQSEGPLLVAAQMSLTGVDVFYWFATGVPEWQPVGNKWTFATPMQQGQFPADALLFRRGYVKRAERPVVYEERGLQNIWDRKTPIIAEGGSYDPNRDAGDLAPDTSVRSGVTPLAFLAGPVQVKYEGDPANDRVIDLAPYVDENAGTVRGVTGETALDYGRGIYRVNAPKAQAVSGFLKKVGRIDLADVSVQCGNDYATIVVVPLDDAPIASSGKLLVQVGTVCRPTGWQVRPASFQADSTTIDGYEIVRVGTSPWQVVKTDATITLRNAGLSRATLLDVNGNAVRDVPAQAAGGALTVTLPPEAMYVVLR